MNINLNYNGKIVVVDMALANNFWLRFSGYMFRKAPHVPGILFEPAGAIQTTFMKFNLDVIFLSEKNEIKKIVRSMKPWRITWSVFGAKKVFELPVGALPSEVKQGDFIEFIY